MSPSFGLDVVNKYKVAKYTLCDVMSMNDFV